MAPISNGTMYPEAKHGISPPASLRVLSLESQVTELPLHHLAVLQSYLNDLRRGDARVELLTVINAAATTFAYNVTIAVVDTNDQQAIADLALSENIDVIHDPKRLFNAKDRFKHKDSFAFTTTKQELAVQIESYLTGHAIAWRLYEPIWHIAWHYKYIRSEGIAQLAFGFINTSQRKNYTEKQMGYVRSLANKAVQIEHAREQLYYYLQLKRSAFRQQNSQNDFSFELVYHLSNYTFFICGTMDVLARLINDLYGLGYGRFQSYTLDKPEFLTKLALKRKTLSDILNLKKYQNWMDWMKERRNNLAHESHVYITPLVQRKDNPLSDDELEKKVDEALDWSLFESAGLDEHLAGLRIMVKQNFDLQFNYDQVVSDMMLLERFDKQTRQIERLIVFPLRTIDEDFAKINEVTRRVLGNLSLARKRKSHS